MVAAPIAPSRSLLFRTHRTIASSSSSALSAAPASWKALHGLFDFQHPLTTPLPGFPTSTTSTTTTTTTHPLHTPTHTISVLPNGLRVVSVDRNAHISTVALFHTLGTRHAAHAGNTPAIGAAAALLEKTAFAAGSAVRSPAATVRAMENTGAAFHAAASREVMVYSAEVMRTQVAPAVALLAEAAAAPAVLGAAQSHATADLFAAQIELSKNEILHDIKDTQPDPLLEDALHAVAFQGNSLGYPLVPDTRKLKELDTAGLAQFVSQAAHSPQNFVLAATDVDHATLLDMAATTIVGSMPSAPPMNPTAAVYSGGEARISAEGIAHVALGFNGVSWSDHDLVAAAVMHSLLGGGGSFSSGGPGKGMYTRLYTRVLVEHPWVHSAQAFNHVYSDAGLFGISASAEPDRMSDLVNLVAVQAAEMASNLADHEVNRAKKQCISSLLMNLESRAVLCEDLGRQVAATGSYIPAADLVQRINNVSKGDLENLAQRFLSSKPSVVLRGGDVEITPPLAELSAAAKLRLN